MFTSENIEDLKNILETVAKSMDFQVLEVNGEAGHLHLMIEYPPGLSISKIVNHLKGVSSRMIKPKLNGLPHNTHLWSPSYSKYRTKNDLLFSRLCQSGSPQNWGVWGAIG